MYEQDDTKYYSYKINHEPNCSC